MSEPIAASPSPGGPTESSRASQYRARAVSPPVDVFENSDEVLLIADVPGVPAVAIDVRVEK